MADHYFIVKFNDNYNSWSIDSDVEQELFPNGTVYDDDKFNFSYQGNGEFYRTKTNTFSNEVDEVLSIALEKMNKKLL
jgi:hypothetical protein